VIGARHELVDVFELRANGIAGVVVVAVRDATVFAESPAPHAFVVVDTARVSGTGDEL
jgi:hypothetical protein